jgi:hypothetical protein
MTRAAGDIEPTSPAEEHVTAHKPGQQRDDRQKRAAGPVVRTDRDGGHGAQTSSGDRREARPSARRAHSAKAAAIDDSFSQAASERRTA